jgi:hypothetical protein
MNADQRESNSLDIDVVTMIPTSPWHLRLWILLAM